MGSEKVRRGVAAGMFFLAGGLFASAPVYYALWGVVGVVAMAAVGSVVLFTAIQLNS